MPMIDSLKVEYHNKIKIMKVNSDVSKKLIKELKLISVPYLVMFKSGKIIFKKFGMATRKELVEIFESNI